MEEKDKKFWEIAKKTLDELKPPDEKMLEELSKLKKEPKEERLTLLDLIVKGYKFLEKHREMKRKKELERLRKRIEELKVEREYLGEKKKLLDEIRRLEEELKKEKLEEAV